MADFDPQGPADNESKNQAAQSESCCGGHSCGGDRPDGERNSFVADWSGAEKTLADQADSFEARQSELAQTARPETFWVELVRSQLSPQGASDSASSTDLSLSRDAIGVQSEKFWAELVRSQLSASAGTSTPSTSSSTASSLSTPPTGMGWSEDEASEWSPPEREPQREYEAVQPAGEPVEAEVSASRDVVEWGVPASAAQDWASARSEGMHFESSESKSSLMAAAVEAAQDPAEPKAKKVRAARKAVAKKPAAKKQAKKVVKAKKPAAKKAAARKPAAKKLVKKASPPPRITKAPTRRAA